MATPEMSKAIIAATRFGFAPKPGELATIARDPQGWVLDQLDQRPAVLDAKLPASATMVADMLEARQDQSDESQRREDMQLRKVYIGEVAARVNAAVTSPEPLLERLVRFWTNHFSVSCIRPAIRGFAGAYEREAIRPYVTGRFVDMLLAVARHPAMLFYLDQVISFGPNSLAGQQLNKGLNENLGREMLELHTLGVDGGYTQADVEALARILTGWSVSRLRDPDAGNFHYYPSIHEPGPKVLLGKTYRGNGFAEGEEALRDLAAHPATAQHVATKLARHFIADDPPPDVVRRIASVFRGSGGDLKRVTAAVIREDAAWNTPFAKLRTPDELLIAACRVTGFMPPAPMLANSLFVLDQEAFFAPSPGGWPDKASDWVGPELTLHRAEWCQMFAERIPDPPDPVSLADAVFGEMLPEDTMQAIRNAASRREGLALLLAAPEFQRR
jgi:uncharacterized protein (DUF1800 family)